MEDIYIYQNTKNQTEDQTKGQTEKKILSQTEKINNVSDLKVSSLENSEEKMSDKNQTQYKHPIEKMVEEICSKSQNELDELGGIIKDKVDDIYEAHNDITESHYDISVGRFKTLYGNRSVF